LLQRGLPGAGTGARGLRPGNADRHAHCGADLHAFGRRNHYAICDGGYRYRDGFSHTNTDAERDADGQRHRHEHAEPHRNPIGHAVGDPDGQRDGATDCYKHGRADGHKYANAERASAAAHRNP
jgi:hypothetical protein